MAEIRGKYVYDDDFTPGRKIDGGLSQNLYNDEGRVETHATFIPDDEHEYESPSEPQGLSDEDRRRAEELGALLGAALVAIAIAAAPHVKRWWLDTAWPGLKKLVAPKPKAVSARDESAALALTALSKAEPTDISTAIELATPAGRPGLRPMSTKSSWSYGAGTGCWRWRSRSSSARRRISRGRTCSQNRVPAGPGARR